MISVIKILQQAQSDETHAYSHHELVEGFSIII